MGRLRVPPLLDAREHPGLVRGLTVGLGAATVLLGGWLLLRTKDPGPTVAELGGAPGDASATAELGSGVDPSGGATERPAAPAAASTPAGPDPAPDCEALAERARDGGPDAVLLAWLCPDRPLDPVVARAALLAVRSPDEAAALVPALASHPALQGLARLVAQDPAPPVATLPDPARAVVSPVDDAVLAQVQRAHAVVAARGVGHTERTRARALLAKVHLQATQQLGVGVGRPPEPFARLLAGRALHYGRLFCLSYWQGRVAGLAALFGEVETSLLALVIALESSPHHGDAARAVVELDESRRYLLRDGPRSRIERRLSERSAAGAEGGPLAWSLGRLHPLPNELHRLLDHGFIDLAVARVLDEAWRPDGPGLRPMEQLLRDALLAAERGEFLALVEHRLARARARTPAPPEHGTGHTAHEAESRWTSATAVADEAAAWLEVAPPGSGLPRRHALGRALLLLRSRPDALVLLLDRATAEDASPALRQAAGWLEAELAARDDGRRSWLQRRVAARALDGTREAHTPQERHEDEAHRRRAFALRMREADRQPRGPGLGDVAG